MVKKNLEQILDKKFQKTIKTATDAEIYSALLQLTKAEEKEKGTNKGNKKLYYISAEFLIG